MALYRYTYKAHQKNKRANVLATDSTTVSVLSEGKEDPVERARGLLPNIAEWTLFIDNIEQVEEW